MRLDALDLLTGAVVHRLTLSHTALTIGGAIYRDSRAADWAVRFSEPVIISQNEDGATGEANTFNRRFENLHLFAGLLETEITSVAAQANGFEINTAKHRVSTSWDVGTRLAVQVDCSSEGGLEWTLAIPDDL
jgi:hypothetical protein